MRSGRRHGKPDAVQVKVVEELRALPGVDVIVVNGEVDIIVGHAGRNYILELKSPTSVTHRSRGAVREKQAVLRERWPGQYDVVEVNPEDPKWLAGVLKIIGKSGRKT